MEDAGKINVYVCKRCRHRHVTINAVAGTTPFTMACRSVGGCHKDLAYSSWYRCDQNERPRYEWYKPADDDPAMSEPSTRQHVESGGLLLRRVSQETLEQYGFGVRAG